MRFVSIPRLVPCVVVALAVSGCVQRKMVIRSDPPGAVVSLDDQRLDETTPVEVPFVWDGGRRVTLSAPGHEVLETTATLEPRWYDYFPLDAFAEFLYPGTIEDVQEFDFELRPYTPVAAPVTDADVQRLRERADDLERRADRERTRLSTPSGTPE